MIEAIRPDTHFTKVGWLKITVNFETKTGKTYSQRQLKNRWDALKKEWKTWKKLKGEDTNLGWNLIKEPLIHQMIGERVVPEAKKFRTSSIDPKFERKLDQMFMRIVITGDKAWTPSSVKWDVTLMKTIKKRKTPEAGTSHFKIAMKKSSKKIGEAVRLSTTSSLTHVMDPYGILQAIKVLDNLSEEVPKASLLYFFSLKLLINKDKRTVFLSINPKIRAW
uniref:Myb/SANT-like domain-containing protein n=1 Tax=Gossypium raimondii TaxID=29730 RepID=A0A0D2PYS1_GOSRA|nr:hypothetical protein B456_001G138200 [Gossypium raimondii]